MAPGTGTPEPGGLTARQLLDAVRRCGYELPLVGVDVVEVSPPYDQAEVTAYLGNRVILEVLSAIARRRRDAAGGPPWDPRQPLSTAADATTPTSIVAVTACAVTTSGEGCGLTRLDARAAATMSRPRCSVSSSITSGGRNRSTLP